MRLRSVLQNCAIGLAICTFGQNSFATQSETIKSIAESELKVDELTEVNSNQLKGVLDQQPVDDSPNEFFVKLNLGNHSLEGQRGNSSFLEKNYAEIDTHPLASIEFQWSRYLKTRTSVFTSLEVGFSTVEYTILPASGVTQEQARMNSTLLGTWAGLNYKVNQYLNLSGLIGYRRWSFRQSSTSDSAIFSEDAASLQYGIETQWLWSKTSGLGLRVFTTDTLETESLAPSSQVSGLLSLVHRL